MLGDGHADRRANTRIQISQSNKHYAYVEYLFHFFAERGLCNPIFPPLTKSVRNDTILYSIRFFTYTYPEFNWIHNAFYTDGQGNRVPKHVPSNISELLTPLALAIWIADDGGKDGSSDALKLSTNNFSSNCIDLLCNALSNKFGIYCYKRPDRVGLEGIMQYVIIIPTGSLPKLRDIVLPYIHPSMKYKL